MNWPSVNNRPVQLGASYFMKMSVDGVEATASGGAGVLRVLGEGYGPLQSIPGVWYVWCVCVCVCVCVCDFVC